MAGSGARLRVNKTKTLKWCLKDLVILAFVLHFSHCDDPDDVCATAASVASIDITKNDFFPHHTHHSIERERNWDRFDMCAILCAAIENSTRKFFHIKKTKRFPLHTASVYMFAAAEHVWCFNWTSKCFNYLRSDFLSVSNRLFLCVPCSLIFSIFLLILVRCQMWLCDDTVIHVVALLSMRGPVSIDNIGKKTVRQIQFDSKLNYKCQLTW